MIKKRCVFIGGAHLCRFHQRRSRSTWPVVRSFTCDSSASIFIFIFIFSLLLLWLYRAALLSLALAHFSLISIRRVFNGKTASMGQNGRKIDFVFNGHSALCFFVERLSRLLCCGRPFKMFNDDNYFWRDFFIKWTCWHLRKEKVTCF